MSPKPPEKFAIWKEAALVISLICNCLNLVGFVSTSWAVRRDEDYDPGFEGVGLWKCCSHQSDDPVLCFENRSIDMPAWFKATQAMAVLGFVSLVLSFFIIAGSECNKALRENMVILFVFVTFSLTGSLFLLIAVITFGAKLGNEPLATACEANAIYFKVSWSYVCCSIAAILHSFSGGAALVQVVDIRTKRVKAEQNIANQRMDQSFTPYTSFPDLPEANGTGNTSTT